MNEAVLIRRVALLLGFLFLAGQTNAQERWGFELRPALNIPTNEVNGEAVGMGPGLEAGISYMYTPQWGVLFGVGYGQFDRFGNGGYFEEIGASLGLRFLQPLIGSVHGSLGAGTVYHRLSMEEGNGDQLGNSDLGFGWQVEGSLALIFEEKWSLTPSVRYRSVSRKFNVGDAPQQRVDLNYISVAVAFAIRF